MDEIIFDDQDSLDFDILMFPDLQDLYYIHILDCVVCSRIKLFHITGWFTWSIVKSFQIVFPDSVLNHSRLCLLFLCQIIPNCVSCFCAKLSQVVLSGPVSIDPRLCCLVLC